MLRLTSTMKQQTMQTSRVVKDDVEVRLFCHHFSGKQIVLCTQILQETVGTSHNVEANLESVSQQLSQQVGQRFLCRYFPLTEWIDRSAWRLAHLDHAAAIMCSILLYDHFHQNSLSRRYLRSDKQECKWLQSPEFGNGGAKADIVVVEKAEPGNLWKKWAEKA